MNIESEPAVFGEWPETINYHHCDLCCKPPWEISNDEMLLNRIYGGSADGYLVCDECLDELLREPEEP